MPADCTPRRTSYRALAEAFNHGQLVLESLDPARIGEQWEFMGCRCRPCLRLAELLERVGAEWRRELGG